MPEAEFNHVRIVRMGLEWVPKEDEEINQTVGDSGADLLIATEWTALQFHDGDAELVIWFSQFRSP